MPKYQENAKHTITARGRMVTIELMNGAIITGRFRERTKGMVVVLEDGARIPAGNIRKFTERRNVVQTIASHKRIS